MASPMKDRGKGLKPFKDQPIMKHGYGGPVWHGVNPTRFAAPLPPIKGPAPGRQARADKGLPGYGDPSWMTPPSSPPTPATPRKVRR